MPEHRRQFSLQFEAETAQMASAAAQPRIQALTQLNAP
jgi:hypothetical protein